MSEETQTQQAARGVFQVSGFRKEPYHVAQSLFMGDPAPGSPRPLRPQLRGNRGRTQEEIQKKEAPTVLLLRSLHCMQTSDSAFSQNYWPLRILV